MRKAWMENLGDISEGLVEKARLGNYHAVHILLNLGGFEGVGEKGTAKSKVHAPRMFLLELMDKVLAEKQKAAASASDGATAHATEGRLQEAAAAEQDGPTWPEGEACSE